MLLNKSKNDPSAPAFTDIPPFTPIQPLICACVSSVSVSLEESPSVALASKERLRDAEVSRSRNIVADTSSLNVVNPRLSYAALVIHFAIVRKVRRIRTEGMR